MITEDYVSFEIAKLLIKKGFGFNAEYESYYTLGGVVIYFKDKTQNINIAPRITLQMAMKWLREVHKIYIDINIRIILEQWAGYNINIYKTNTNDCLLDKAISLKGLKDNASYEQACEAAIKYCLEHLI